MRILTTLFALGLCAAAHPVETATIEQTATLEDLFPADQAKSLAATLPPNQAVAFRARYPAALEPQGVLVFVQPRDSGEPPPDWLPVLDDARLIWISADGFGNDKPTAQRVLVALMAHALAAKTHELDANRTFIAGMSGGGRVASQVMTRFPGVFAGAIYIVGADASRSDSNLLQQMAARRYVFITGTRDFNRREMRQVYESYVAAGANQALFMDLRGFGHEYPNAEQLAQAIGFLDAR